MTSRLLLYIDNDYILPVVDDYDGNLKKFNLTDDLRLWLYFYDSPHKTGLDHGRSCKANYETELPGYYGNFWNSVQEGVPYSTPLAELDYCELLEQSGILGSLKEFYSNATGGSKELIPTVCIFSDNIPLEARKIFLGYMARKSFEIISYSVSLSDLIGEYTIAVRRSIKPEFGDKIIILQSSGKDLLMSYSTFDGNSFLIGEAPERHNNIGNDPLKQALVRFVVNKIEEQHNFLSERTREKEYNYQMQFVDEWLKLRKNRDSFTIDNFHYSSDPAIFYSCKVDSAYLKTVQEKAIQDILQAIQYYKNRNVKNDLFQVVLLGEAFNDDFFQSQVVDVIGDSRKVIYLPVCDIPAVLNKYIRSYGSLQERVSEFDAKHQLKSETADSIFIWVKSAENIRLLQTDLVTFCKKYETLQKDFVEMYQLQQQLWTQSMKNSDFARAKTYLEIINGEIDKVAYSEKDVREISSRSDALSLTYTKVSQFEGAKRIVDDIHQMLDQIDAITSKVQSVKDEFAELGKKTNRYEQSYPLYQEKLKQIKKERSYTLKKKLSEELQELTMEDIPVVDVDEISINIKAEVIKKGSFFSKKKLLKVIISIESGKKLPCRCMLVIAPRVAIKLNRDYSFVEEFDAGISGNIELEYELPLTNCEKAKDLYLYFWPHEDELISINAFLTNKCSVTL